MNIPFSHRTYKTQAEDPSQPKVFVHEHPHNTMEGSEFLDDAIRIKDQPLMYSEEAIAPGCPNDLL